MRFGWYGRHDSLAGRNLIKVKVQYLRAIAGVCAPFVAE
jgi:hypothetical protein